ncbi:putative protease [Breznakibacter xylanolyticus]|uniref:Putative protease n=1 Tax=Breznakibacter xylanolyticus TaxID=990 RepID=A0A2W7NAJ9_9BACT|nr:peptidase U32 family protein [Breznakibacter xylanolyticus]PZX16663.1 putative protease [Breznakibacter xylanolyticus]
MSFTRQEIEIMAPAGSYESLMAAIQGGADSVYFGVEKLNMRARSSANFTIADLHEIVRISREHGVKTYLTVNTVLYDDDLPVMRDVIDAAKEAGVTAIIAADQAAIHYARSIGVEVHISTQVNISNIETLKFYSHYADVVVLARELNMTQVAAIHREIERQQIKGPSGELIRIEMFVHGALCMAVSGKCYLSLHQYNSSANRGGCLQTCRRSYVVTDKETGNELEIDNEYIMSPKDLKTIGFLDTVLKSGVRVLKIEGRARSADYVKMVVSCYHEAVAAVIDGTFGPEKVAVWDERLSTVFNRGFWDGYYMGQTMGEWTENYGNKATRKRVYAGKVTNYFPKLGVAEILLETRGANQGDTILITGPTTGVMELVIGELRVDLQPVDVADKGVRFSMPVPEKVRRSDKVFLLVDAREVPQQ